MTAARSSGFAKVKLAEVVAPGETRDPRSSGTKQFSYVDISSVCNRKFSIVSPKSLAGADAPSRARKVIKTGDVLYATTRPYLKSIASVTESLNNQICSTGFCVLRPTERILPEWLFYCATSEELLAQIKPLMRGATYPAVTDKDILGSLIPLPSIPEQQRIIGRIKECIVRVEEIELLQNQALIEARHLAPSLYEAIENKESWPLMAIDQVTKRSRNGRSIRQDNENATGYVLSLSAVREITLNCDSKKPIPLPDSLARQYAISEGDVFVSRANTRELVGLASIAEISPDRVIYPDLLIKLEIDPTIIRPRYLAYALRTNSSRRQIKERAVGTSQSMVKISAERLKEVTIRVPSLADQDNLLETLDSCQSMSLHLLEEIRGCDTVHLRDAILRRAFAGEL
jgi:type I restriction enzyme S subunit